MKTLRERMERFQLRIVRRSLRMHDGCIARTAAALGISRPTLYDYMHKHGLAPNRITTTRPPPSRLSSDLSPAARESPAGAGTDSQALRAVSKAGGQQ